MSLMMFWAAMSVAVANSDSIKSHDNEETTIDASSTKVTEESKEGIDQAVANTLIINATNDLATGEIESALRSMTDDVRVTTAYGKTYNGKKEVRAAINTALNASVNTIASEPNIVDTRQIQNGLLVFGQSNDTINFKEKPLFN